MKNFLTFVSCMILSTSIFSQDTFSLKPMNSASRQFELDQNDSYPYATFYDGKHHWRATPMMTMGLAAGAETFFGVKASFLGRYAYSRRMRRSNRELTLFGVYGGLEVSGCGLFAVWGSAGVNTGISIGPLTLDGSLSFWGIRGENNGFGTTTYTPKLGMKLLDVFWVKTGLTYFLRGESVFPDWMKAGNNYVNFELSFVETF